jgi:hypothetical protein
MERASVRKSLLAAFAAAVFSFVGSAYAQSPVPISRLPPAATPLTGAELLPCVQGGVTKSCLVAAITSAQPVPHGWLPNNPIAGQRAAVSDAATCVFGITPTYVSSGGGFCPVIYNGSAWIAG